MSQSVAESKEKELARKFVAAIGAGVLFFDFDKVLTTKDIPPHLTEIFKNTPEPYVLAILGFASKIKVEISPEEKTALEKNFKKELGDLFTDINLFREIFAEIERKGKKAGIVSAQDNSETAKALYLSRIIPVSQEERKAGELSLLSIERAGTAQASRHELLPLGLHSDRADQNQILAQRIKGESSFYLDDLHGKTAFERISDIVFELTGERVGAQTDKLNAKPIEADKNDAAMQNKMKQLNGNSRDTLQKLRQSSKSNIKQAPQTLQSPQPAPEQPMASKATQTSSIFR